MAQDEQTADNLPATEGTDEQRDAQLREQVNILQHDKVCMASHFQKTPWDELYLKSNFVFPATIVQVCMTMEMCHFCQLQATSRPGLVSMAIIGLSWHVS